MQGERPEVTMPTLLLIALLGQAPGALATRPPPTEDPDLTRAERLPLEILGGIASGALAGGVAASLACLVGQCSGDSGGDLALMVGVVAAPLGSSAGTTLVGNWMDGNGSYLASTGGVVAGGSPASRSGPRHMI
jgi:hypothetical protein